MTARPSARLRALLRSAGTWSARLVLAVALVGFLGSHSCGVYYGYTDDDDWCHRHDDDDEYLHCHDDDTFAHDDDDDLAHHTSTDGPDAGPIFRAAGEGAELGTVHLLDDSGADAAPPGGAARGGAPRGGVGLDLEPYRLRGARVATDAGGVREVTGFAPLPAPALLGVGALGPAEFRAVADRVLLANAELLVPAAARGRLRPADVRMGADGVLVGYALGAPELSGPAVPPPVPTADGEPEPALLLVFDAHGDLVRVSDATAAGSGR